MLVPHPEQIMSSLSFIQTFPILFLWPTVFHYSKRGQDISLPQGPGSDLLVTELGSVDYKEMIRSSGWGWGCWVSNTELYSKLEMRFNMLLKNVKECYLHFSEWTFFCKQTLTDKISIILKRKAN